MSKIEKIKEECRYIGNKELNFNGKDNFILKLEEIEEEAAAPIFYDRIKKCDLCSYQQTDFSFALQIKDKDVSWNGILIHYIKDHSYKPSSKFIKVIEEYYYDYFQSDTDEDFTSAKTEYKNEGFFNRKNLPILGEFKESKRFLKNLANIEMDEGTDHSMIKGFHKCVFCEKNISSMTMTHTVDLKNKYIKWKWINNYDHYILEHRVIPSKEFQEFVNNFNKHDEKYEKQSCSLKIIKNVLNNAKENKILSSTQVRHILTSIIDEIEERE